jgi:hypothetical protein
MPTKKTTKKKTYAHAGRPEFKFDYVELEKLCRLHPTDDEIAAFFGCSRSAVTVHKEDPDFAEARLKGEANGKLGHRRLMQQSCEGQDAEFYHDKHGAIVFDEKGKPIILRPGKASDTAMQIFLAKNWLGMTDRTTAEVTGKNGGPVEIKTIEVRLAPAA